MTDNGFALWPARGFQIKFGMTKMTLSFPKSLIGNPGGGAGKEQKKEADD
jgi:hypothetical protein